ncbi:MAG: GIY-YIG catalytic domain protein [Candidatus Magasanikbacteria bacterium GW2011_GWD2_43_18]|nr:MAG: GIY-YIG catalytic domain protein [Candidatus Magasanikbacteria bacterium GW2011_GWC2_42_27]KKT03880.1 MAG: GIY-YIG catalytic domain protein [Candidatus Magasanikbacteria bacterium GW2011_GWD2_43_18]KKT25738.1 MAG: GIY-YIG catalytic domain protein [Candidatus Magasanikbacteria bacterium GW2011_GWA2_43_9]
MASLDFFVYIEYYSEAKKDGLVLPFAKGGARPSLHEGRDISYSVYQTGGAMFYTYLLQSTKDNNFYIGSTTDLKRRFTEHNDGKVSSTKFRRPMKLVYYEAYPEEHLARVREQKLKDFGSAYTALLKRLGYK